MGSEMCIRDSLDLERLHAVIMLCSVKDAGIMLRSVKDADSAFVSVVAALNTQGEDSLTIGRIHRQLNEAARDSKLNVVTREVIPSSGASFIGSSGGFVDMCTCYRCGEKGHVSPDGTNKHKPEWKPKATDNVRNMRGSRQDSRSFYFNAVSHFASAGTAGRQMLDFAFAGNAGKQLLELSNVRGDMQDSREDYSNAVSHFALAGSAGKQFFDFAFAGTAGEQMLDFAFAGTAVKQVLGLVLVSTAGVQCWISQISVFDGESERHYTHDRKAFTTFTSYEGTMRVGSGELLAITGAGSIEFTSLTPSGSNVVLLREVYFVPKLMANLFANTELDQQGVQTVSANEVKQLMLHGVEVMRSRVIGGLWVMGLSVNDPDAILVPEQAALWASEDLSHHRLCLLSHAGMAIESKPLWRLKPLWQCSLCGN